MMFRRFFRRVGLFLDVLDGIENVIWFLLAAGLLIGLPIFLFWRAFTLQHWWVLSVIPLGFIALGYLLRQEWRTKGIGKVTVTLFLLWATTTFVLRFLLD